MKTESLIQGEAAEWQLIYLAMAFVFGTLIGGILFAWLFMGTSCG